jgi:hypothetical protein
VVLHNTVDHGAYGNLGLAVRGIEIYLPISSRLVLMWMCPTIERDMRDAKATAAALSKRPELRERVQVRVREIDEYLIAAEKGSAVQFLREHVERINWLQVRYSEERIFAEENEFSFARKILVEQPKLKKGPRGRLEWPGSGDTPQGEERAGSGEEAPERDA